MFLYGFEPGACALSLGFAALTTLEITAVAVVNDRFETDLKGLYWGLKARPPRS